jgi:hypothetical protein
MVAGEVMEQDAHLIRNEADRVVREPGQGPAGDAVMMKLSFDSGASVWEPTSVQPSALCVPVLLAAA